jgi:hypothetical protein
MKRIIVPVTDPISAYGIAALRVQELRRKGVRCHIERNSGMRGQYLEVMRDPMEKAAPRGVAREGLSLPA